jgi:hypothetical protein
LYFLILGCGISLLIFAVFPYLAGSPPQPFPARELLHLLLG